MERKLPTIHDVAKEAKVSIATVSHVLNKKYGVSGKTNLLVLQAIKRLGYAPNEAARGLKAGTSRLVGIVAPDQNPFFTEVLRGVQEECQRIGWQVVVASSEESEKKQLELIKVLTAQRVGGIILAPVSEKFTETGILSRVPIVLFDREVTSLKLPSVSADNVQGSRLAADHLIQHGHRRIGIILASPGISTTYQRYEGYTQALKDQNISVDEELVMYGGNNAGTQSQIDGGYNSARQLMGLDSPPTAIFATNHLLTLGALKAFREMSVEIPAQCAFIGFDDHLWEEIIRPSVTVISQPTFEIGKMAIHLLTSQTTNAKVRLPLQLIVRESCGCLKN
jgi:DNA-binding LacI/PurR family transcriptional regulator